MGSRISDMTSLGSLPASGAVVPVVKNGDSTNYKYDLAADLAARARKALTRAIMAGLATDAPVYLSEPGREGIFVFSSTNISANCSGGFAYGDTQQGVYVLPSSDTTGASGAWVRRDRLLVPSMFGCVGDNVTNDLVALQAFNDFLFDTTNVHNYASDWTGKYAISGQFFLGPTNATEQVTRWNMGGRLCLQQLTATFESVRIRNLIGQVWEGSLQVIGTGGTSWSSRTCGVGFAFENCAEFRVTGELYAQYFWYAGIHTPVVNNDGADHGIVRTFHCGSGHSLAGASLTATFAGAANSGGSGSVTQTSVLSGVSAFPPSTISTYAAVGSQILQVRINGYLYYVNAFDSVAGTVTVYPWIDPAVGSSGSLTWVIGGGWCLTTSDANIVQAQHVDALQCGRGISIGSLYGPRVNSTNIANCGTGIAIGRGPATSCIGASIDGFYPEGNIEDIVFVSQFGGSNYHYVPSGYEIDLTKVWAVGDPRVTGGAIQGGSLGTVLSTVTLSSKGRLLQAHDRNIALGELTTDTFYGQTHAPRIHTRNLDSQTVTLAVQGSGEYNRLFGYKGTQYLYVGSGVNGAPTGTFTFNPPTGGTVNGGSVNAGVSFSGFTGPALFTIFHTDTAQLTWVVQPVSGWRLKGSATVDPPSIASGASSIVATITVAGAALGDRFVAAFGIDLQGLTPSAYVSAANTVKVVLANLTGGAVDLASSTVTVSKVA